MLDLKITGGTIIDGTGSAGYRGDVGIRDGRIVVIGTVDEPSRETIDATGRVVSPGFIDNHTHYDAQAFWDPTFSPSCYHGVTTIVGGFCGFSIAPLTPESAAYIKPMLARVEGMPLETLEAGVPCNWRSFGEFLDRMEGKIGLNAGFFAGHSAIRRVVMKERAVGDKATDTEVGEMKALLDQCLADGALGFSTTVSPGHIDADGQPVPSRWADPSEFMELASVVAGHEGTGLEMLPNVEFPDGMAEFMTDFSIAGNRPLNWNVLAITGRPDTAELAERQLAVTDLARARGAEVIALTLPSAPEGFLTLRFGPPLDVLPGAWNGVFKLPPRERIERLRDPAFRDRLAADADSVLGSGTFLEFVARFAELKLVATRSDAYKKYEGRLLREIADEEGSRPIDVLLDIAIADDLYTIFCISYGGRDRGSYELRGRLWADDRTLIGASDAGAHLDSSDAFSFSTTVLQKGVREQKIISLEEAVHQMTQRSATYFGLVDRGTIAEGQHADLVIFDPDRITRGPTYFRHDLPGSDAFRLYADAIGIDHVIVNGTPIVSGGKHTGALPGTVLRSGRDTRTVAMDALRSKRDVLAAE
jgi:N-acyl-D-aspartate/D-glutamate deacylase